MLAVSLEAAGRILLHGTCLQEGTASGTPTLNSRCIAAKLSKDEFDCTILLAGRRRGLEG